MVFELFFNCVTVQPIRAQDGRFWPTPKNLLTQWFVTIVAKIPFVPRFLLATISCSFETSSCFSFTLSLNYPKHFHMKHTLANRLNFLRSNKSCTVGQRSNLHKKQMWRHGQALVGRRNNRTPKTARNLTYSYARALRSIHLFSLPLSEADFTSL